MHHTQLYTSVIKSSIEEGENYFEFDGIKGETGTSKHYRIPRENIEEIEESEVDENHVQLVITFISQEAAEENYEEEN